MWILQTFSLLLLLGACNDIDGRLRVFKDFSLVDEDGRQRQIAAGKYSADFSYDRSKHEIELEIDDFDRGKDIDFEFHVPHMDEIDFDSDEIEVEVLAADNGQSVDLNALIAREVTVDGPFRASYGTYCYDDRAYYYYPFAVYDIVETEVDVNVELARGESEIASFEAAACTRRTSVRYCVDCYGRIHYGCSLNYLYRCD